LGRFGRFHGDEGEATGLPAHAIHHQVDPGNSAVGGECVFDVVFSGVEGKVSNKQFRAHSMIAARLTS
jgi:hypothetical protein